MKYVLLFIAVIILNGCSGPKFKVDDCVKDRLIDRFRKITEVEPFIYKYKLYFIRTKDWGKHEYFMRIKDFDERMRSVKCPKESKGE